MTVLFLPFPPSTNGLYKNRRGGRCKTDGYIKWLADAQDALLKQLKNKREHTGMVDISIHLKAPDKRRCDADNRIKATCDFLVTNGIIKGDDSRYVRSILVRWDEEIAVGCYVKVSDCA